MSWLLEFLSDLSFWLRTNEFFRSGFITGIALGAVVAVSLRTLFILHFHWKKVRQFFEPTKKPGKMPAELGPSPASMSLGCTGRILFAIIFTAVVILVVWRSFPES